MNNLPVDPNLMPLIASVKPYLGPKAKSYADIFTGVMKLLTSSSGKEVITTMSKLMLPQNVSANSAAVGMGNQMFGANIAFSLFLILVLLIFATGGMGWGMAADAENSEPDACTIDVEEV